MGQKKLWQSKTIWVALVQAILAFFPGYQAMVVAHPELFTLGISALMAMLRKISHEKVAGI